jgi:hypothetical protein
MLKRNVSFLANWELNFHKQWPMIRKLMARANGDIHQLSKHCNGKVSDWTRLFAFLLWIDCTTGCKHGKVDHS